MKWKDNPELWDEVLELSRHPAEEIKRTDKVELYQAVFYGEEGGRFKNSAFTCDKVRLKKLMKIKGLTYHKISEALGINKTYIGNALKLKRMDQEIIDDINALLGEEILKVVN